MFLLVVFSFLYLARQLLLVQIYVAAFSYICIYKILMHAGFI